MANNAAKTAANIASAEQYEMDQLAEVELQKLQRQVCWNTPFSSMKFIN